MPFLAGRIRTCEYQSCKTIQSLESDWMSVALFHVLLLLSHSFPSPLFN
ncbi:hypothetical protein VDIAB_220126 [Vibrio diabolicus]|nr:hypothetical protein VDIAB_220126 [Vibrio diabolicus]